MQKKKYSNLIICYTPLQIIIAEEIIRREQIKEFVLVFYYSNATDKVKYYYKRLAAKAAVSFFRKISFNRFNFFKVIPSVILKLKKLLAKDTTVFCGNIKSVYSRVLVIYLSISHIRTFDDGMGNIAGAGYLYRNRTYSKRDKCLKKIGFDFTYANVYKRIEKHYTISPNYENVMPHAEPIAINFESNLKKNVQRKKLISVIILSNLSGERLMNLNKELQLYSSIIKDQNIKKAIPHPIANRQNMSQFSDLFLEGKQIAEELILSLANEYEKIKVYGFYSSVLLNLSEVDEVECINLKLLGNSNFINHNALFDSLNFPSIEIDLNKL